MSHEIVWTFDTDHVSASVVCTDDECLNRYNCKQPCEVVYDVRREPNGIVTHKPWDDDIPAINRHVMEKANYCNVVEFMTEDPSMIPELTEIRDHFEIGRTTIEPVWNGDDGVLWKRAVS